DDALAEALRGGVEQVVILGAGFDSRAYRVQGIERTRVFEVDHPATQAEKKKIVARRLGALPPHVAFVPIDFGTHALDRGMPGAGFRAAARTFFVCEGVTHYLSAPAVDAMFGYVARSAAAGSRMVFTYIHRAVLGGAATFAGAARTLGTVRRVGEPYTLACHPARLPRDRPAPGGARPRGGRRRGGRGVPGPLPAAGGSGGGTPAGLPARRAGRDRRPRVVACRGAATSGGHWRRRGRGGGGLSPAGAPRKWTH